jgi:hypothetical protein
VIRAAFSILVLATWVAASVVPVAAQTNSQQFEGQFFTARVANVAIARNNGHVFVTVVFRGKDFGISHNVALANGSDKSDNCATLIDDLGGQYVAVRCLPTIREWYGNSGLIIRSNTDTVMAFEFSPVDRSTDTASARFNMIVPFVLMTCQTIAGSKQVVYGNPNPEDCAAKTYRFSNQSMSFFDLSPRR